MVLTVAALALLLLHPCAYPSTGAEPPGPSSCGDRPSSLWDRRGDQTCPGLHKKHACRQFTDRVVCIVRLEARKLVWQVAAAPRSNLGQGASPLILPYRVLRNGSPGAASSPTCRPHPRSRIAAGAARAGAGGVVPPCQPARCTLTPAEANRPRRAAKCQSVGSVPAQMVRQLRSSQRMSAVPVGDISNGIEAPRTTIHSHVRRSATAASAGAHAPDGCRAAGSASAAGKADEDEPPQDAEGRTRGAARGVRAAPPFCWLNLDSASMRTVMHAYCVTF